MTRRSDGRPSPSRGARVERRKALREQAADRPVVDGPREMAVPDEVRTLGPTAGPYGVADYRSPLTEFERRAGVLPVDATPKQSGGTS